MCHFLNRSCRNWPLLLENVAESGAIAKGLRGAFNVLGKAQKNLGIFGLSDDDNKGE